MRHGSQADTGSGNRDPGSPCNPQGMWWIVSEANRVGDDREWWAPWQIRSQAASEEAAAISASETRQYGSVSLGLLVTLTVAQAGKRVVR